MEGIMKRVITLAMLLLAPLFLTSRPASAVDPDAARKTLATIFPRDIETSLALTGAPEHLREAASVYVFGAKGFTKVREGSNGFTCLLNRDAFFYGMDVFKPTCWDREGLTSYVPVMLRVGEMLAAGNTADEIRADIQAGFREGRFHRPQRTGIAYMRAGDLGLNLRTGATVHQAFPGHYMIYAPGVTSADLGYAADAAKADRSLPFIFESGAGGSDLAYLITVPHAH